MKYVKCEQVDITHINLEMFLYISHFMYMYIFGPCQILLRLFKFHPFACWSIGLLYGAAIGDALGLATRGMSRDECSFYYNEDNLDYSQILQDKHRVLWRAGDWTSNFDSMVGIQNLETFHKNCFS